MKKVFKLEAIRGGAAVYVVLHHIFRHGLFLFGYDISVLFQFGQEAVILFFILSGFVIKYAYEKSSDKSIKTFILKRFLRIYIPLILVFLTNYIICAIYVGNLLPISWITLVGNLFMLQDVSSLKPNVICNPFMNNVPLWSLSYEWWFYIVFIVLITYKLKYKKLSMLIYILGTVSSLTYIICPNFINRVLMYLIIWWVGVDIADLYHKKLNISLKNLKIPFFIIIVNLFILFFNVLIHKDIATTIGVYPYGELRHFIAALVFLSTALLWKKCRWIGFNLTLGMFEPIACISFGIYISHWFLIVNARYLNFIENRILQLIIYSLICVGYSWLIERFIYPKVNSFVKKKIFRIK